MSDLIHIKNMEKAFDLAMDGAVNIAFEIWKERGLSNEDMSSSYLSYYVELLKWRTDALSEIAQMIQRCGKKLQ